MIDDQLDGKSKPKIAWSNLFCQLYEWMQFGNVHKVSVELFKIIVFNLYCSITFLYEKDWVCMAIFATTLKIHERYKN
jgi:hypothetical protein